MAGFLKEQVSSHKAAVDRITASWQQSPPQQTQCIDRKASEKRPAACNDTNFGRGTIHHEAAKVRSLRSRRSLSLLLSSILASCCLWLVWTSTIDSRFIVGDMHLREGNNGILAFAAAALAALTVGPAAAQSANSFPPFVPIDPQSWVNPDNMTWDEWVRPPGTNWSDPSHRGRFRNFNIALVVVDYPDRPFIITEPDHSTIFNNPQAPYSYMAREGVPAFYRDLLNKPTEINRGHTLHEYWMEDSVGRYGVDLAAFGPYKMPGKGYQYGIDDSFNPGACPPGEKCGLNLRTDALAAWRAEIGNTTSSEYELVFILSAGQDESSTWQEFGEMKFNSPEDVPDEFGPSEWGHSGHGPLPNYAATRYVPWTSWASASTIWPNAFQGSSTQGESSGMAVYAHELSHLLKIGDNYNNPYGLPLRRSYTGPWSMMSRGSFNGPGGPHTRWQVPSLQGSSMGSLHTVRDKFQLGLIDKADMLWLSREALNTSGIVVANLTARSVDPRDGLMGVRIMMDADRSPSCNVSTEVMCDGGGWNNYEIEVVDRMGSDSFQPDAGVLITKTKNEDNQPFQWVIDANPQDIKLLDFHRPNGSEVMVTLGDYRQLADALFHAGPNSGSEFELIDRPNSLHLYVIDRDRDEMGILSYTVAVRSLDGKGKSTHAVGLGEGAVVPFNNQTPVDGGVTCEFQLTNNGSFVTVDREEPQHPDPAAQVINRYLLSDVYRLSAEVEGAGWRVALPNALATAKFGESKTVRVSVGAKRDAAASAVVTLKATSESDACVTATAQCKINKK